MGGSAVAGRTQRQGTKRSTARTAALLSMLLAAALALGACTDVTRFQLTTASPPASERVRPQRTPVQQTAATEREHERILASYGGVYEDARLSALISKAVDKLVAALPTRVEEMATEMEARRLAQDVALAVQAALLCQTAPPAVFAAFCDSRLAGNWGYAFGTLGAQTAFDTILARAMPREVNSLSKYSAVKLKKPSSVSGRPRLNEVRHLSPSPS